MTSYLLSRALDASRKARKIAYLNKSKMKIPTHNQIISRITRSWDRLGIEWKTEIIVKETLQVVG